MARLCYYIDRHEHPERGAATLLMTVTLMTLTTLIIIFAANYSLLASKSIANINRVLQAFNAAEAGLEFGLVYLRENSDTILANTSDGFIQPYTSSSTTNVPLANKSSFSVNYTNPVAYDYNLIKITAVGTNDDGSATRTVSQLVEFGSLLSKTPVRPLTSIGNVSLANSAQIINIDNDSTIESGSSVTLNNSSQTILSSGVSSTSSLINSDIAANNAPLAATSTSDFFSSYFGLSNATVSSTSNNYFTSSSSTDYSYALNGKQGTSIFIDQTNGFAVLNGSAIIGTSSNPVIIIINGNAYIGNNTIIYGFIYLNNPSTSYFTNSSQLIGGLAATGKVRLSDSAHITYSTEVLNNLKTQSKLKYYAKIPGSWKDF